MNTLKWTLCYIALLLSLNVTAAPAFVVDIVLPAENAELRSLVAEVDQNDGYRLNTYVKQLPKPDMRGNVLVVISDAMLPLFNNSDYTHYIALYVSKMAYENIKRPDSTAIYSHQPLNRQIKLIAEIVDQRSVKIGLAFRDPDIKTMLQNQGDIYPNLDFIFQQVIDDDPERELNKLIQRSDILLSSGESSLYNSQTIRSILLSSYRQKTLVIGPSEGFVNAGALASVISTRGHYANDLSRLLDLLLSDNALPPPDAPSQYSVKVNYSVARSMGLSLPSEAALRAAMARQ